MNHPARSSLLARLILAMLLLAATAPAVLLIGCNSSQQTTPPATAPSVPTVTLTLGDQPYVMEIAANEDQRQLGLMHRTSLPEGHGMIFLFTDEDVREFWMKDVPFDLDLVFLNKAGRVVRIVRLNAMDESARSSDFPAFYALELPAGAVHSTGLKVGMTVKIPVDQLPPAQ